jgi:hypothetical protein
VRVDLEADGERGSRADAGPDTTELLALDCPVQLQGAAPERFVPEGVEAKNLLSLVEESLGGVRLTRSGSGLPEAVTEFTVSLPITNPR